jgi:sRNA-binding carbon storage regulator CsrA
MLILARHAGEKIIIETQGPARIEIVQLASEHGKKHRTGFTADRSVRINRAELLVPWHAEGEGKP